MALSRCNGLFRTPISCGILNLGHRLNWSQVSASLKQSSYVQALGSDTASLEKLSQCMVQDASIAAV